MEIIATSIQTPKPMNRIYAFITDRVFIASVLAFSVLAKAGASFPLRARNPKKWRLFG